MDKRLITTFVVLAGIGFVVLFTMNKQKAEQQQVETTAGVSQGDTGEQADAADSAAAMPSDPGKRRALETTVQYEQAVDRDGFRLHLSNIGATIRSALMLGEQYAQRPNEERFAPLDETLRGAIPEQYYTAGPLELVSTWDPAAYPFQTRFDSFEYEGKVRRVLRPATGGGRVSAASPTVLTVAGGEGTAGFRSSYPAVVVGDMLEVTAPASLKAGGPRKITAVRGDGELEVDPPFSVSADVADVQFRVVTEGAFDDIYARDARFTLIAQDQNAATWVWPDPKIDTSDLFIERRFEVTGVYTGRLDVTIHNYGPHELKEQLSLEITAFQPPIEGGGMFSGPPPDQRSALCYAGDELHRTSVTERITDEEGSQFSPAGNVGWIGVDSRYFLMAAVPLNIKSSQCRLDGFKTNPALGVMNARVGQTKTSVLRPVRADSEGDLAVTCVAEWAEPRPRMPRCSALLTALELEEPAGRKKVDERYAQLRKSKSGDDLQTIRSAHAGLMGRAALRYSYKVYTGPKDVERLSEVGADLDQSLDFWIVGFLAEPMVWLLRWFHGVVPHWGVAIILLTILVKLLLLPITQKSFKSMRAMQLVKPEMDKLKEKYGNDKQKLNEETMALYKRHKVNPLGGCLPMLLQMPVYIALYRAIYSSVELYQAPLFGWITDLSAPDPFYILPVILGASMFLQQKVAPTSMDSSQARMMMYVMPIMFTVFMLFLPSGLVLYIFVNTLLSMVQQYMIKRGDGGPKVPTPAKS